MASQGTVESAPAKVVQEATTSSATSPKTSDVTSATPAAKPQPTAPKSSGPTTATGAKGTANGTAAELPKFKIVKVRKPDGTIIKVRRPIVPGAEDAKPSASDAPKGATQKPSTESSTPIANAKTSETSNAKVVSPAATDGNAKAAVQSIDAITPVTTAQTDARPKPATAASTKTPTPNISATSTKTKTSVSAAPRAATEKSPTLPTSKPTSPASAKPATSPTSKQTTPASPKPATSTPTASPATSPKIPDSTPLTEAQLEKIKRPRYKTFSRFSSASRLISGLIPDVDLDDGMDAIEDGGDMMSGDEEVSDDDTDYEDSDRDNDEDSDDEKNSVGGKDARRSMDNGRDGASHSKSGGAQHASSATEQAGHRAINNTIKKGFVPAVAGMFKPKPKTPASPLSPGSKSTPSSPQPTPAKEVPTPILTSDVETTPSKSDPTAKKDTTSASSNVEAEKPKPSVIVKVTEKEIKPKHAAPAAPTAPTANGTTHRTSSGSSTAGEDKLKPTVTITEKRLSDSDLESGKPPAGADESAGADLNKPGFVVILVWSITILFPLGFIALGVCTAVAKDKPWSSGFVQDLEQANKIALTAWPIFFAAIVAQSLKAFATYRVERGIRLRALEQLLHSTSFASAVKQPFFLRGIDLMAVALVALWSLSPIASQAMQRMKFTAEPWKEAPVKIFYLDTTVGNAAFNSTSNPGYLYSMRDSIDAVYSSATLPRGDQDLFFMDTFRYPLVPDISQMIRYGGDQADANGWIVLDAGLMGMGDDADVTDLAGIYYSHAGIPYMPFGSAQTNKDSDIYAYNPRNGTYQFNMTSSQFTFDCEPIRTIDNATKVAIFDEYVTDNDTYVEPSYESSRGTLNMIMNPPAPGRDGNLTFASLILYNWTVLGTTIIVSNHTWATTSCQFRQRFVDSSVYCQAIETDTLFQSSIQTGCYVTAARLSRPQPPAPPLVPFASNLVDAGTPDIFLGQYDNPNISTFFERYIMDPTKTLHNMQPVNLTTVNEKDLKIRVTKLFNTYWQAGFAPMYQAGFNPEAPKIANGLDQFWRGANHHNVSVRETINATFIDGAPVYGLDYGWLAGLFLCSVILLVVGIAGIIWEYTTVAPDILGFANSLVRQSKKVKPPSMALSGHERARALKDMRVQMQDIRPNAPVGKIALAKAHEDKDKRLEKKLKPGRFYE